MGYDYVLLDGTPLLGLADAQALGQRVDEVLVVSRLDRLSVEDAVDLRDLLERLDLTPLGHVVVGARRGVAYSYATSDLEHALGHDRKRRRRLAPRCRTAGLLALGAFITLLLTLALWAKEPSSKLVVAGGRGTGGRHGSCGLERERRRLSRRGAARDRARRAGAHRRGLPDRDRGRRRVRPPRTNPNARADRRLPRVVPDAERARRDAGRALRPCDQVLVHGRSISPRSGSGWRAGDLAVRVRVVVAGYLTACVFSALLGVGALYGPVPGRATFVYAEHPRACAVQGPELLGHSSSSAR